jgi:oligopeptide transport system substrate-binding protein
MSEVITDSGDSFTRSAGRQLLLLALFGIAGFALLMLVLGWLSELTGSSSGSADAVDAATGTITLSLSGEPPQLDSTRMTDQVSGHIMGHIMEGLLRYDAQNRLAPGVAEKWEITPEGAIFHLRENARWSNGEPVTAADFVFSWRRTVTPATASEYAFIMFPIKNAEAISNGELDPDQLGVRALDPRTLEVTFERPVSYFDKLMAFSTYLPIQEAFFNSRNGRYAADAEDLLYNGPFTMTRWVHGAHIRFEKNELYWDKDRIRLNVIDMPYVTSDTNAVLNLFKDGKIAVAGLDAETLDNALEQRWQLNRFNDGSVFFLEFNHRPDRLTHNRNLRKALQLVTDPGELVYKVMKLPGNLPGESLFPIWLRGVNGRFRQEYPAPLHRVDVDAARRHLELAKQELGLEKIPALVMLTGDNPVSNKQSEYFQNVFKKTLDIDVKIDKQIFKQRLAKMTSGQFDMVMAGWGPDFDDPLTFGDLFSSWNANNRGLYNNPELDRQVRIAQASLDPKTRMDAFAEIQRIIYEDAVILTHYERGVVYVRDPRLQGVVRRAVGTDPDYTNASIVDS